MNFSTKEMLAIGLVIAVAAAIYIYRTSTQESFSGAYDPSLRNPVGVIGPLSAQGFGAMASEREGYCGSCAS